MVVGGCSWLAVVVDYAIDRFVWCFFGSGLYMVAMVAIRCDWV